ncbi:MAG: FtsX-like permease family protein [Terriglobales bacterium]
MGSRWSVQGAALAAGIYGVLFHRVRQRRTETGIRAALGARPRALSRWVLAQAMPPVLAGAAAGLIGAWLLARALSISYSA